MNFIDTAFKIKSANPTGVLYYLDGKIGKDENGAGTFSLEVKEKVYQLETYRVSSTLPKELSSDLGFLHGIDVNEMLTSTLENGVKANNQKLLLSKYYYLSEITRNNELRKSRWNRFLLRFISESHFCFHFESHNDMIKKILFKSNLIGHKTKRGNADFIVCPPKYSTYIMESPSFVYKDTKEIKISDPGVIDFIGTIGDRIQVFVDRNSEYTENRILIGKKTKEQDCGVYFVQGDKSTDEILDEIGNKTQSLRCRQAIISPEGAEISFGIIRVSDSKRPFWKKLLFIK